MKPISRNLSIEPVLQHSTGELVPVVNPTTHVSTSSLMVSGTIVSKQPILTSGFLIPSPKLTRLNPCSPSTASRNERRSVNIMSESFKLKTEPFLHSYLPPWEALAPSPYSFQRIANLLSQKLNQNYQTTINWIRCKLSFALIRSSIRCIRGSRSPKRFHSTDLNPTLALSEGSFNV